MKLEAALLLLSISTLTLAIVGMFAVCYPGFAFALDRIVLRLLLSSFPGCKSALLLLCLAYAATFYVAFKRMG